MVLARRIRGYAAMAKASKCTAAKPTKAPATAPQGRGNLQGQANAARLADAIRKARQALAIGNFTEALRESAFALRVDRNNKEAQDLFARAQELLGEKATTAEVEMLRAELAALREAVVSRD